MGGGIRTSIYLNPEAKDLWNEIAEREGRTKTEVLHRALRCYDARQEAENAPGCTTANEAAARKAQAAIERAQLKG